jgi:glycosyltransferase involved in cell wall biosynthesis
MDSAKQVNRPRILIALQRYEGGGAERQAAYLAEGLISRGYVVEVMAFGANDGLAVEWFKAVNITTQSTGFSDRLLLDHAFNVKALWLRLKYERLLVHLVRKMRIDVIIPFTYPPNVIYGSLWKRMGVRKCVWNQRDEGRSFMGRPWELRALRNCSTVISNSLEGQIFLEKYFSRPIKIIHNAVKTVNVSRVSDRATGLKVIMVANLHLYKDHLTLLRAWCRLMASKLPIRTQLVLAGKELNAAPGIKEFIQNKGLEESVKLMGQVSNMGELISNSDIAVFSSKKEGMPNGVLECMAAGLPVISNRLRGTLEALGADNTLLFNTGDDEELYRLMAMLIFEKNLRVEIGNQNLKRVENLFNFDRMIENYSELIENTD